MQIDARGKACPQPVILAKKELDGGSRDLTVLVDNRAAVENLTRLGNSVGVVVSSGAAEDGYFVRFVGEAKPGELPVISCPTTGNRQRTKDFVDGLTRWIYGGFFAPITRILVYAKYM